MNLKPMKCRFIGLTDWMGIPVVKFDKTIPHGLRAMIVRLDDHPDLGPGYNGGNTVHYITSKVMSIDFNRKMIYTENSVYYWGE